MSRTLFVLRPARAPSRPPVHGFSLIELLVSMAIGLIVTLAISSVLIRTEGTKRSTTTINDLNQNGAFIGYALDRAVRDAGSGFTQRWSDAFGCQIDATKRIATVSTQVLPMATAPGASSAFKNFDPATYTVRLAPVVIAKGIANGTGTHSGDVLMILSGAGGASETPRPASSVIDTQFQLQNTIGLQTNDLMLLVNPNHGPCMLEQLGTVTAAPTVSFAGSYYATSGAGGADLTNGFAANTLAVHLGTDVVNPPNFSLYGVGPNNELRSWNLLIPGGDEQPVADGVVSMRALYGLDSSDSPDGVLDEWVDPSGDWAATALLDGSAAARIKMRQIVAIRIGFVLRTSLSERAADYTMASPTLTLFNDLATKGGTSLKQTVTFTGSDVTYRYRTVEVTIPLRNMLLAPAV